MRWKLGLKVLQSISVDIVLTIRSNLDVFFAVGRCCYSHDTTITFSYLCQPFTTIECPGCYPYSIKNVSMTY